MKTFYDSLAAEGFGRQANILTNRHPAFPGFANQKGKVSGRAQASRLPRWKAMGWLLCLSLLLGHGIVKGQDFVNAYNIPVINVVTMNSEKTIHGYSADSSFYLLCNGRNPGANPGAIGVTTVTKLTKNGGVIWSKEYTLTPNSPSDKSYLQGYAMTVDSGPAATGNLAIGGYATLDSSATGNTDEDFVMEIDTSGAVLWLNYWNPNGAGKQSRGVTDLIFSHEPAPNTGCIAAVSVDTNTSTSACNLYITLVNNLGIIAAKKLPDAGSYSVRSPFPGTTIYFRPNLKPRIVECELDTAYFVIGTRKDASGGSPVDIGIWKTAYGLASGLHFTEYYETTTSGIFTIQVNTYATGAIEDNAFNSQNDPAIFVSGFYEFDQSGAPFGPFDIEPNPLMLRLGVLNAPTPAVQTLHIPWALNDTSGYMYPTDIAVLAEETPDTAYQLMMPANYYDIVSGVGVFDMYIFTVPMNFLGTPNATYDLLTNTMSSPINGETGGITATKSPHLYMLAGQTVFGEAVVCRTDDLLDLCNPTGTKTTLNPQNHIPASTPTSSVSETASSATPNVDDFHTAPQSRCAASTPYTAVQRGNGVSGQSSPAGQVNAEGIANLPSGVSVHIYPSPVHDNAFVDISGQQQTKVTIHVYDLTGRELSVQATDLSGGTDHIAVDMQSFVPGLYLVKVLSADNSINATARLEKY